MAKLQREKIEKVKKRFSLPLFREKKLRKAGATYFPSHSVTFSNGRRCSIITAAYHALKYYPRVSSALMARDIVRVFKNLYRRTSFCWKGKAIVMSPLA